MEDFKTRLKMAMELRKVKAIDLAREVNVSRSLISQYLSGTCKAKQDVIYSMAKCLSVSPSWLMGLDVPMITANGSVMYNNIIALMNKMSETQLNQLMQMIEIMFPSIIPKDLDSKWEEVINEHIRAKNGN